MDLKLLFLTLILNLHLYSLACLTLTYSVLKFGKKESIVRLSIRINLRHHENYRSQTLLETAVMPRRLRNDDLIIIILNIIQQQLLMQTNAAAATSYLFDARRHSNNVYPRLGFLKSTSSHAHTVCKSEFRPTASRVGIYLRRSRDLSIISLACKLGLHRRTVGSCS